MNLYTEAGGLFGTHVTWSDIEGDMQRELNTTAFFGPNKSAKDIGEGNSTPPDGLPPHRLAKCGERNSESHTCVTFGGFMSKVLLIEPDWQHKDKEVPEKFVAKIVTQLAVHKLSAEVAEQKNVKNIFNNPEFRASLEKRQKKAST
ncbi:unnamed protein product [Haemonchus placei]|uniref:CwfJ_C_2 domain-containing protein n=1 Tax=Haemonchus placei TaxID=6290 RepID=A0A0N4X865_HAEPC|nr:unnamed protein product [Haemonchus placei]